MPTERHPLCRYKSVVHVYYTAGALDMVRCVGLSIAAAWSGLEIVRPKAPTRPRAAANLHVANKKIQITLYNVGN